MSHAYIFSEKGEDWRGFFFVDGYRMVLTNDGKCNVNAGKRPIKLWSFVQTILIILYDDIYVYIYSCFCLQLHQTWVLQDRFQFRTPHPGDQGQHFFFPEEITMAILDFMFLYSFLAKSLSYTYRSKHETSLNLHYPNCG